MACAAQSLILTDITVEGGLRSQFNSAGERTLIGAGACRVRATTCWV
jgi:hypothetical protein